MIYAWLCRMQALLWGIGRYKLADLLREHILIAGKIAVAAKAGNQADVKKLEADWHTNADDIAKFLSAVNPNWQFKALQDMLYTHLQLITEIVLDCTKEIGNRILQQPTKTRSI